MSDLRPLRVSINKNLLAKSDIEREAILENPQFGTVFTDHMFDLCWSEKKGWHRARVIPYGPLHLDPAASALHYGQEIFEGLKFFRHSDGSVWSFRPEANAKRMQESAIRMAMPVLPVEYFLTSLEAFAQLDGKWVPSGEDMSLYVRPFMFAKEAFLGVRPAKKYGYYVIASPASAYFVDGVTPITVWISSEYARAGIHGTGRAKTAGNYAASLLPQRLAAEQGCNQVLFLGPDAYIEELGGMNLVFVYKDGTLVTPKSETILRGITLESLLQLARDRGYTTHQRPISLEEARAGIKQGDIVEIFACGTAAAVTPVGLLKGDQQTFGPGLERVGEVTLQLRNDLMDIQYGRKDDVHGWMYRLSAPE